MITINENDIKNIMDDILFNIHLGGLDDLQKNEILSQIKSSILGLEEEFVVDKKIWIEGQIKVYILEHLMKQYGSFNEKTIGTQEKYLDEVVKDISAIPNPLVYMIDQEIQNYLPIDTEHPSLNQHTRFLIPKEIYVEILKNFDWNFSESPINDKITTLVKNNVNNFISSILEINKSELSISECFKLFMEKGKEKGFQTHFSNRIWNEQLKPILFAKDHSKTYTFNNREGCSIFPGQFLYQDPISGSYWETPLRAILSSIDEVLENNKEDLVSLEKLSDGVYLEILSSYIEYLNSIKHKCKMKKRSTPVNIDYFYRNIYCSNLEF